MKQSKHNQGQTLLELIIAMVLGAMVLAGVVGALGPSINLFNEGLAEENSRLRVINTLDNIEREATQMRSLSVDGNQCYSLCMGDANGNRTYYYWGGPEGEQRHLYRKTESTAIPISCAGGKVVAENLHTALSTFSMSGNLLKVNVGLIDSNNLTHQMNNVVFPAIQERDFIFTEGFECNTLNSGWIPTDSANSGWAIQGSANSGYYRLAQVTTVNSAQTASIEIPLDLSRISAAHLNFSYMNDGSIVANDSFVVELWDGSNWQTIFSDASGLAVSTPQAIDADLSGYGLNASNIIRFTGTERNTSAHWYIDGVSVYNP